MTDEQINNLKNNVMDAIQKRGVLMRPRWHFMLLSALSAAGVLILVITLLYAMSLAFFFMQENGGWYVPVFGGRGWFAFLQSAPLLLLGLVAFFAVLLEILVRKYSFAYRAPLLLSLGAILMLVCAGGFALAQTSLHRMLDREAHHGRLPPPFTMWYKAPFKAPPPGDIYRGFIVSEQAEGFIFVDYESESTSTVLLTPKTKLPYGKDFEAGDFVIIIGDGAGTGTIRAFGIRSVDDDRKRIHEGRR